MVATTDRDLDEEALRSLQEKQIGVLENLLQSLPPEERKRGLMLVLCGLGVYAREDIGEAGAELTRSEEGYYSHFLGGGFAELCEGKPLVFEYISRKLTEEGMQEIILNMGRLYDGLKEIITGMGEFPMD